MGRQNRMVVLLDGECTMCSCFGHFVSKFDPVGTFRFASQQSPIGDEVMEHCEGAKAHALNSILVCDVIDGTFEVGSTAVLKIFAQLPSAAMRALASVGLAVPLAVRDKIYYCIARRRHAMFGRSSQCAIKCTDYERRVLKSSKDL